MDVTAYHIERMPHGGYVVREAPLFDSLSSGGGGRFCSSLFAATDIGEALNFIRHRLTSEMRDEGMSFSLGSPDGPIHQCAALGREIDPEAT